MASSSSERVVVKCSKGEVLEVEKVFVNASQTLKRLIEEKGNDNENMITLPDISRVTLSMINNYVKKHANANHELVAGKASKAHKESLNAWDAEFMKVDQDTLYDLIAVAHYLKIESLIDLGYQTLINMINGNTLEQIQLIFNVKNDFTPEEEEENLRRFP